jgi:acyl dehydratase
MVRLSMNEPLRFLEDVVVGEFRRSAVRTVKLEEMITFAREYDPQWFHVDPDAARASTFGEVVASGVYIAALWRQLDHTINSDIAYVCGVGWDEVRWPCALRADDTIHVTSEVLDKRPSASKTDRGIIRVRCSVVRADTKMILTFVSINLVYTRAWANSMV